MSDDSREYKIALAGTLPAEQANGWADEDYAATLDGNRAKIRYARIAYNVMHSKEVTASGKRILTMQLHRIEPVDDGALFNVAQNGETGTWSEEQMLTHLFEQRTGQTTLFGDE